MKIATILMLTLLAPAALNAQQAAVRSSANGEAAAQAGPASLDAQADADTEARLRVDRAMQRARAEGLGTTALEARVREGRAKGIAAARIAAAVEKRLDAMLDVRSTLRARGDAATESAIGLGAIAVESGASASQVADVTAAFSGQARARALTVLGELAAQGRLGSTVALDAVRAALDPGADAEAGAALPAAVGAGAAASVEATVGSTAGSVSGGAAGSVRGTLRP